LRPNNCVLLAFYFCHFIILKFLISKCGAFYTFLVLVDSYICTYYKRISGMIWDHNTRRQSLAPLLSMHTRNSWSPDNAPVFYDGSFPTLLHVNESARWYFSRVQVAWEFLMLERRIPEWRRIPCRTIRRVRLESGFVPRRTIRISRKGFSARVLTLGATSRRHTSLLP